MIDIHCHLIPGFDDGAADLAQSRAALETLREQGVRALVATTHLDGSITSTADRLGSYFERLTPAWDAFKRLADEEFPDMRVERGTEVMLDTPAADVSDARVRLAGTGFVLIEFPYMAVPPNSVDAVFELRMKGWAPVIAHPERYGGVDDHLHVVEEWRRVGGLLQVNCGSLLGRYGGKAKSTAWRLLRRGWVDYLASDYHARGACGVSAALETLAQRGGDNQARLLMEINPRRLLDGKQPEPVSPLTGSTRRSFWGRLFGSSRR